MFNASIIYFVIHESSFLFFSSVFSSLSPCDSSLSSFILVFYTLLIYLLPSFRHRIERGRERDSNLRGIIKINSLQNNSCVYKRHSSCSRFYRNERIFRISSSSPLLPSYMAQKSLSRKEILISDSQAKVYYLL